MKFVTACFLLVVSLNASAAAVIQDLRVSNPERNIGYIVGDKFTRTVDLEVGHPYKLSRASLPIEGTRYNGIELRDVKVSEKTFPDFVHYRVVLTYQVFARSNAVIKAKLPSQALRLTGTAAPISISIPAWMFRISPIAVHGVTDIEKDMSPYRPPLRVEVTYLKPLLGAFLAMVFVSVLGLIYINANNAWFPGMGGPFSESYRKISTLKDSPDNVRLAVASIQQAFNLTYGENLFSQDIDRFLQKHSNFMRLKDEIEGFFQSSNAILFGIEVASTPTLAEFLTECRNSAAGIRQATLLEGLTAFCKACRDHERGIA